MCVYMTLPPKSTNVNEGSMGGFVGVSGFGGPMCRLSARNGTSGDSKTQISSEVSMSDSNGPAGRCGGGCQGPVGRTGSGKSGDFTERMPPRFDRRGRQGRRGSQRWHHCRSGTRDQARPGQPGGRQAGRAFTTGGLGRMDPELDELVNRLLQLDGGEIELLRSLVVEAWVEGRNLQEA